MNRSWANILMDMASIPSHETSPENKSEILSPEEELEATMRMFL